MIHFLLPNTNIYLPKQDEIIPCSISQSSYYYLEDIQNKIKNIDYSYFQNIYKNLSKIKGITDSFYIFIELIQHFDIIDTSETYTISYYPAGEGGVIDWGIFQAFDKMGKITRYDIYKNGAGAGADAGNATNICVMDEFTYDAFYHATTYIIKFNNLFDELILKQIYYLCSIFNIVYIAKPFSSWIGSSTKYIVCKELKPGAAAAAAGKNDIQIDHLKMTHLFLTKCEEMNCIFIEYQIDMLLNIYNASSKPEKMNSIIKLYQQRCNHWCIKHDVASATI